MARSNSSFCPGRLMAAVILFLARIKQFPCVMATQWPPVAAAENVEHPQLQPEGNNQTMVETMTLCLNCSLADLCVDDNDPQNFLVPVGTCFNPLLIYPDSGDVWGEYDVLDECNYLSITRKIFSSTNATCSGEVTDEYHLPYDSCLGPFGAPRPWGVFTCKESIGRTVASSKTADRSKGTST